MRIKTKFFGEIEIGDEQIIIFPFGIYGFEDYHRFVLLHDEQDENGIFRWLQCADEEGLCFTLMEPGMICGDYLPKLPENSLNKLGARDCDCFDMVYLVITVLYEEIEKSTVNLLSPIVINPSKKIAAQIILEPGEPQNTGYKTKHKIFDLSESAAGQGGGIAECSS